MSWFARIRSVAALGAVVSSGLLAGAFLSVSSAKERKPKPASPVTTQHPDAGTTDARAARHKPRTKRTKVKPDADKVRRAQPIPRDYVE